MYLSARSNQGNTVYAGFDNPLPYTSCICQCDACIGRFSLIYLSKLRNASMLLSGCVSLFKFENPYLKSAGSRQRLGVLGS